MIDMENMRYLTEGHWFKVPETRLESMYLMVFEEGTFSSNKPVFALLDKKKLNLLRGINSMMERYYMTERGYNIPVHELKKSPELQNNPGNIEEKVALAKEILFKRVPFHAEPTLKASADEIINEGEPYAPLISWKYGAGGCQEKASLLAAILRNFGVPARVVGIDKFPERSWKEIFSQYQNIIGHLEKIVSKNKSDSGSIILPQHYIQSLSREFPGFVCGDYKVDYSMIRNALKRGYLNLIEDFKFGMHFWVEVCTEDGWRDIDTTHPIIQDDEVYSKMFEAMKRLKYTCIELKKEDFKGDKIIRVIIKKTQEQPDNRPARNEKRVGRNQPCTCGSGKKFKKCCGT